MAGQRYDYGAFGNRLDTSIAATTLLYGGEQWDAELGMEYLRARYYDPSVGQFSSFDTFEGTAADPISLHKYVYANAEPVSGSDPSGHFNLTEQNVTSGIQNALNGLSKINNVYRTVNGSGKRSTSSEKS